MRIDLPQVGETVTEGVIVKWLKQPGDAVKRYESLVEVETDKVAMEVPSPVAGTLTRVLAKEGETVPMGHPICDIETSDSPFEAESVGAEEDTTGHLIEATGVVGPTGVLQEGAEPAPRPRTARLSPLVKKLADEHGVPHEELEALTGTGAGGRVSKEDVLRYVESRSAAPATPAAVSGDEERVPLTAVRRRIADHVSESARTPTAWSMVEVDVTGLVALRDASKAAFREREGVDLTYLPFALWAVAESLTEHSMLNSTWGRDKIVLKRRLNIGIAVAAPQGLVVPVIKDTAGLGVTDLAKAVSDLTRKARENRLALPEVQGGTFTVNNTGALGSVISHPLLNGREAAIMTTEAIIKRPVVIDDAVAVRSMMNLCLTFDHRILDGSEAGAFLQSVRARLEAIGPETAID
jgi:2-oxoisovalerate dehydrogenase E2 component (dihydrolipoyl transacylase)